MKVTFSIDLHDKDGDKFESGIYLHFGDVAIIRFEGYADLEKFIHGFKERTLKEIRENLGIEPENIDS